MKPIDHTKDGSTRDVPAEWFVGSPAIRDMTGLLGTGECEVLHVAFPPGAKTRLHAHRGGQMLIVTDGSGSLVTFERTSEDEEEFGIRRTGTVPLRPGSIQYIPAGVLHTHGSDGSAISHIAINYPDPDTGRYETAWYGSDFEGIVTGRL